MKFKLISQWFAVCFLVTTSIFSGVYAYLINPPHYLVNNDGAVEWESRMLPIRKRLPVSTQEIGYISDKENLGSTNQEYLLTKYALIPIAVRRGTDHEWIIGNFTQPDFRKVLDAQIAEGYELEKFGFGIYLIHRLSP